MTDIYGEKNMLNNGDILIYKGSRYNENGAVKFLNTIISYFQENSNIGDFVHATIVIDAASLLIVEATMPVVKSNNLNITNFIENEISYFSVLNATKQDIDIACATALTFKNIPYDWLSLFGLLYTNSRHALYCTRLVCKCYPQLWSKFKTDKLISPDELILSGLLSYKGNLSREILPDYYKNIPL